MQEHDNCPPLAASWLELLKVVTVLRVLQFSHHVGAATFLDLVTFCFATFYFYPGICGGAGSFIMIHIQSPRYNERQNLVLFVQYSANFVTARQGLVHGPLQSQQIPFVTAGGFNTSGFIIAGETVVFQQLSVLVS